MEETNEKQRKRGTYHSSNRCLPDHSGIHSKCMIWPAQNVPGPVGLGLINTIAKLNPNALSLVLTTEQFVFALSLLSVGEF